MASSYIGLEQQQQAKICVKHILEVEPTDMMALYLRGQANELRAETKSRALRDYQGVYDICIASDSKFQYINELKRKLNYLGGVVKKNFSGPPSTNGSSQAMTARKNTAAGSNRQDMLAVSSNSCCCDHSEGLIYRLKRHGRFNRVLPMLLAFIMIMAFMLVRKRQLLRRVLAYILKLAHQVARKP